jgi:serine/threonine protein kinase
MQSDSAQPAGSSSDGAGGAPSDETSRRPTQATVAAKLSSFQGLVGSTGDSAASAAPNVSAASTPANSRAVPLDAVQVTGVGQTFGRYRIKKVLGAGNMGSVFLAHDSQLEREVALKVPRLERDTAGELSQRLHREARAAATLNHPNICPIYDVTEQGGTCFIAMGYVAGKPLSAYLAGKKVQPEREVAKVVRKIALALEEAHAQGILHRDLKPSNIMIDKRGEPIVMDFGVACWVDDRAQTRLTQQGALVGTPAYMSPEQIEGRTKLGPASDIYSLGVVLYELLTGRCPFQGTVLNVISQVLHQTPPDPRQFRQDLSPQLAEIINRAMRKDPADRFASMRDFAKALTAFLNGPSREGTGRADLPLTDSDAAELPVPEETFTAGSKLERIKHQPLPTALPPRRSVKSNKKRPKWIPVGYGVVGATGLVVGGAVIGAWMVGSRGADKSEVVAQSVFRHAESPSPSSGSQGSTPIAPPAVPTPPASVAPANTAVSSSQGRPTLASTPNKVPSDGSVSADGTRPTTNAVPVLSDIPARTNQPGTGKTETVIEPGATLVVPKTSAPAAQTVRDGRSQRGTPVVSSKDDSDPPDSKPAGPGTKPQTPADDRPPRRAGGPAPFDGGPKKGMSIEQYFHKLDTNGDDRLDPSELPLHIINRADTNKDGELTLSELKQAFKKRGQRLFNPPTAAELRRLPRGGPPPPGGGPGPPGSGGPPPQGNGGL